MAKDNFKTTHFTVFGNKNGQPISGIDSSMVQSSMFKVQGFLLRRKILRQYVDLLLFFVFFILLFLADSECYNKSERYYKRHY